MRPLLQPLLRSPRAEATHLRVFYATCSIHASPDPGGSGGCRGGAMRLVQRRGPYADGEARARRTTCAPAGGTGRRPEAEARVAVWAARDLLGLLHARRRR